MTAYRGSTPSSALRRAWVIWGYAPMPEKNVQCVWLAEDHFIHGGTPFLLGQKNLPEMGTFQGRPALRTT